MEGQSESRKTRETDNPWQDLVVSILSVNQYSLEKTYQSIGGLQKQGLFDPQTLIQSDQDEIVHQLKLSGCDRGQFMTKLFALRLAALGDSICDRLDTFNEVLSGSDSRRIEELLIPINGIGPKVISNFFLLRGIKKNRKHT
ncbi:MAG: hypothetical protein U0V70_10945 [Terriglobia bacterium]